MIPSGTVHVLELASWGFDEYAYRSDTAAVRGMAFITKRSAYLQRPVILRDETKAHEASLRLHEGRHDLLLEMTGLEWSLAIVDLRNLLSFQRRLSFDPQAPKVKVPTTNDWAGLIDLAFGPMKAIDYDLELQGGRQTTVRLQSSDPNFQFQISSEAHQPLTLYAGSPFLEVACFRGRWFLRDGYHRAYALLQKNIFHIPAVVVEVRTLAELGATRPWFFSEDTLFSDHPPLVTDFLDDRITIDYVRPRLLKTLKITIEESFSPVADTLTKPIHQTGEDI